jgi:hypothetical protein
MLNAAAILYAKAPFFPLFMRARRIVEHLRQNPTRPKRDVLFAAIASRLSAGETAPSIGDMRERMMERPYALFIDELDKLSSDDETEVLSVLGAAQAFFDPKKKPIKLIACGQPVSHERVEPVVEVRLDPPTTQQRLQFFEDFAATQRDKAALRKILDAADKLQFRTQTTTGSASSETFDSPLLLNAFCWGALQDKVRVDECNGQVALCENLLSDVLDRAVRREDGVITSAQAQAILQNVAFSSLADDVDDDDAANIVAVVAGTGRESSILDFLVDKAHLLERTEYARKRNCYRVRGLFSDYFAARQLAANEGVKFLENLTGETAQRKWRNVLAFACALMWKTQSAEARALSIIDALLERAEASTDPADQAAWLHCAAACLNALAPIGDSESPPQQLAIERASAIVRGAVNWTPKQRADAIAELSMAVRRTNERETRRDVNALCKSMLGLKQHWIAPKGFVHPAGDKSLRVAGMPVLVAHYGEFLAAMARGQTESVATETRLSQTQQGVGEAGIDVWAQLSAVPAAPMVFISFHEAVAYCIWLTNTFREMRPRQLQEDEFIRLPTFAEWRAMADAIRGQRTYLWGNDAPGDGAASRINWRGANIGAATPPGVFPPYGAPDLYDFSSNVAVWTTPDRPAGSTLWPPQLAPGENPPAIGVHFASRKNDLSGFGGITTPPAAERRRERGVRLVRTRCITGWDAGM